MCSNSWASSAEPLCNGATLGEILGIFDALTVDECMKSIQDDPWFVLA